MWNCAPDSSTRIKPWLVYADLCVAFRSNISDCIAAGVLTPAWVGRPAGITANVEVAPNMELRDTRTAYKNILAITALRLRCIISLDALNPGELAIEGGRHGFGRRSLNSIRQSLMRYLKLINGRVATPRFNVRVLYIF